MKAFSRLLFSQKNSILDAPQGRNDSIKISLILNLEVVKSKIQVETWRGTHPISNLFVTFIKPLTANSIKIVKHTQAIRRQNPTNRLSVFDHFVRLALKALTWSTIQVLKTDVT